MEMKRVWIKGICILVMLYIAWGCYIGFSIYGMVQKSYASFGEENPYGKRISDENFAQMCCRNSYGVSAENSTELREVYHLSFPLVLHWFTGGKTIYRYTYEIYDENGQLAGGSWNIPVTLEVAVSPRGIRVLDLAESP